MSKVVQSVCLLRIRLLNRLVQKSRLLMIYTNTSPILFITPTDYKKEFKEIGQKVLRVKPT